MNEETARYATLQAASKTHGLTVAALRGLVRKGLLTGYRPLPGRLLVSVPELDGYMLASAGRPDTRGRFRAAAEPAAV